MSEPMWMSGDDIANDMEEEVLSDQFDKADEAYDLLVECE
jgi:hypothetical protein